MVRNLIEDVVPPNRRSIRKIPVPATRGRRLTAKKEDPADLEMEEEEIPRPSRGGKLNIPDDSRAPERVTDRATDRTPDRKFEPSLPYVRESYDPEPIAPTRGKKTSPRVQSSKRLWITAIVAVIALFIAFSLLFSGTKVSLTAHEEDVIMNAQFSASKNSPDDLAYDVMSITKEGDKTVPATGSEVVHRKASGQMIVYNYESTTEQKLVKNTRFESSGGLIFRTPSDVTIPGKKTDGTKTVPGSVEITVYADQTGDTYNIPQGDFTIPGFKDTPKFKTIYARSKGVMSGGFEGNMNIVSGDVLNAARTTLDTDLSREILVEAKGQKPEGTVIFDQLASPIIQSSPSANSPDGKSVTIHEKVTLSIPLFTQKNLSDAIGKALHASTTITVTNTDTLEALPPADLTGVDDGSFLFGLRGTPHVVSVIDQEKIKQALAGKPRKSLFDILSEFPGVSKAEVSFRPFWCMTFPTDPSKITIDIKGAQ